MRAAVVVAALWLVGCQGCPTEMNAIRACAEACTNSGGMRQYIWRSDLCECREVRP